MAKREKRYAFQLGGQDYSVLISWGTMSENGEVYVNDTEVHRWKQFGAFKRTGFVLDGFNAEVVQAKRTGTSLLDVSLIIEGRDANTLPTPTWFHQYVERPANVIETKEAKCPDCSGEATMLIYDTGKVEVACPSCGRSSL